MKGIIRTIQLLLVTGIWTGCNNDDTPTVVPADVQLISPTKDQVCEPGTNSETENSRLIFEWEKAENAQSYDLVVDDIETGENFIVYKEIYDTKKELELVHNRAYSWHVISKNINSDVHGTSPTWNFYFVGEPKKNYAPFPSKPLYPDYGSTVQLEDGKVTLRWETTDPDKDKLTYTLFLDEIDGLQEPTDEFKNIEIPSYTVQLEGGTYYWRVKASDGTNSSYSQVYTFTIN
ncbi:hypothetical protein [Galbibacter pacificus]|uniref:Fibronectin type-III domain-containing protein n=1 Tax=Galbibacter pacificus TaxID=2996052 RepID=A0ABT6FMT2_9FLAO|nr:hypothetical protein [Galbibacter pacificus]MDG3581088.1 hypothetical protein [Galbibacter pacificus]MDG3584566.1 hypothetical protein [Galbibacter pacificus]